MKTTAIILKVVAILWWCGIGLVMVPHFIGQSGLCGEPEKPREVSEQSFESPHYKARNLAGALALTTLAGVSVLPHRLLRRSRIVFLIAVAVTSLPFVYFAWAILLAFMQGGMGAAHDTATILSGVAATVMWSVATLSLPTSLVLSTCADGRKNSGGPNHTSDGIRQPAGGSPKPSM